MTPAEWKRKQLEKLEEQKARPLQKISNNFINNAITNSNTSALKIIFYLAAILEEKDLDKNEKGLNTVMIDAREMFKYTDLNTKTIRDNFKAMQKTSITFLNEKEKWEEHITLIPRIFYEYGKNRLEIDIYTKIANLIIGVKKNYTFINTKELMNLKNPHSIRLLLLLNTIANYDADIPKRKHLTLQELNEFFGTKYKRITDIERFILAPIKEELDNNYKLSFLFELNFEVLGKGRPKAKDITIDVIKSKSYKPKLF